MHSILQDEKSSEKLYALPCSDEDFENLEERFRSLILLTVLEIKKRLQRKLKGITEKRSSAT